MNKDTIFNVLNRSGSTVVYSIPEDGIRRQFVPGETKRIKFEELEKLSYQTGGAELIGGYLLVSDAEALEELNVPTEEEYYMTRDEIIDLLKFGSLDKFLDCLDFAPVGVLQLVKDLAVELPLNDVEKRKALKEKTGFDVDKAVANVMAEKADDNRIEPVQTGRRVKSEASAPARRVEADKYKVVNKQES